MSLIKVTEALIAERVINDELLANLTAAINADIADITARIDEALQLQSVLLDHRERLKARREELATEFAARRASLSALIGEEGAGNG